MKEPSLHWQQLKAVVQQALELPLAEQEAFLEQFCGDDDALRREASVYIASQASASSFMKKPAVATAESDPLSQGTPIGRYQILDRLGEGGMGEVYLAERADGTFEGRFAIKVLRARGLLASDLLDRFISERQILAEMKHPNIAHLVDGGVLEDGRPYLVMEYVDGVPIDRFCVESDLSVEGRLRLFLQVCDAVQHAHRLLVVHRDLKPSNILVTQAGTPKLLDFGVAKDVGGAGKTPDTRFIVAVTPEYASPEQLTGTPVTTAVDVYALGVVLRELLTGQNPFAENPLADRSSDTPASRQGGNRGRRLSGDLKHIVVRALHTDPIQRYPSVEQLSREIDRHLRGLPLESRGGVFYRLGKALKRHWKGLAGLAVVGILAGGLVDEIQERRQLEGENQRISKLSDELGVYLSEIFLSARTSKTGERSVALEQALDRGAELLDEGAFENEPLLRARLLGSIGQVYRDQGWPQKAEVRLREVLAIRREHLKPDHRLIGFANNNLALGLRAVGKYAEALGCMLEASRILRLYLPEDDTQVATLLNNLAGIEKELGRFDETTRHYSEALEMRRRLGGEPATIAMAKASLGTGWQAAGRLEEAEASYREALDELIRLEDPSRIYQAAVEHHLGRLLRGRGDVAGARDLLERALELRYELRHPAHRETLETLLELALVDQLEGRFDVAEKRLRRVVEMRQGHLGAEHPKTGEALVHLGRLLAERGDVGGAVTAVEKALAVFRRTLPAKHWRISDAEGLLAELRYQ